MLRLFAVIRSRGSRWNDTRAFEMQSGWREHAAFMNALAAKGFVVAGAARGRPRYASYCPRDR
jgi:hypothetical protein